MTRRSKLTPAIVCYVVIPAICFGVWSLCSADTRGFPTAEGQGSAATGARNASAIVIQVTTLTDSTTRYCAPGDADGSDGDAIPDGGTQANNWEDATGGTNGATCTADAQCANGAGTCLAGGLGSLRRAITAPGYRYIIPRVSGEMALAAALSITSGTFTYLGHLAPANGSTPAGIIITGRGPQIKPAGTDNWIMRYAQFNAASGDLTYILDTGGGASQCDDVDALTIWNGGSGDSPNNFMIDHSIFTGGSDETLEISKSVNWTVQRSVIAAPMYFSARCSAISCDPEAVPDECEFGSCSVGGSCTTYSRIPCITDSHCPTSSTCVEGAQACSSLTFLAKSEATGSLVKNFFGLGANRNPKWDSTTPTGHGDIINNFIYGTNEGAFDEAPNKTCAILIGSNSNGNGNWNVIGNYNRMGPECTLDDPLYMSIGPSTTNDEGPVTTTLYPNDNIIDVDGNNSTWTGVCDATATGGTAGIPCVDDSDCNSVTNACDPTPCPASSPCGNNLTGINDRGTHSAESSAYSFNGTVLAGSAVDDAIVVPGTRDVGPNYPAEGAMLDRILDYGYNGTTGDPMACAFTCNTGGSPNRCPDGSWSASDDWQMGTTGSGAAGLFPHNCTSSAHPVFTIDTLCGGTSCTAHNYTDSDVDGIADSWESTHCADTDCDPNSTSECDNSNWTLNGHAGDTTTYPCIELFAYELLGEVTAPTTAVMTIQGGTITGGTLNQ